MLYGYDSAFLQWIKMINEVLHIFLHLYHLLIFFFSRDLNFILIVVTLSSLVVPLVFFFYFYLVLFLLRVAVLFWAGRVNVISLVKLVFFSTGTSVCQRTDQVVPPAIRVMAAPEYHRATIQPRFHSTDLHIPFPLISTPSVNAVTVLTAGSVTLPGLLDKVSFSVFFLAQAWIVSHTQCGDKMCCTFQ